MGNKPFSCDVKIQIVMYGNVEKEELYLEPHNDNYNYKLLESFLQSENIQPFRDGVSDILYEQNNNFILTGNAYTVIASKSITKIIEEVSQEDMFCELSTDDFLEILNDYLKKSKELYINNEIKKFISEYMPSNNIHENYSKIDRHEDLKNELYFVIKNNSYPEEKVSVCGYTAEKLQKETRLNMLGAYNYLIFLREKPDKAKELLLKGLPVK